jgi:SSS family solute:Na+ symporter
VQHFDRLLDLSVLGIYLVVVTGYGCWFYWRNQNSDRFMAAGRSLPGWAVGLSIFGSYVSSISFLANPGKSYADNWNASVLAFSMPLAAWIAVRWFVPFYRQSGEISAYHHLERRFGPWARTYAVFCFLLVQLARLGTILYLLALALQPLVGLDVPAILMVMGLLVTVYPFLGGTEASIWVGVVQAIALIAGTFICVAVIVGGMPGGVRQVFEIAAAEGKFSLGSFDWSVSQSTFWVVFLYGLVTHLQNFGIDQGYVQRYITARSDADSARSVWIGTVLFIPISLAFFFIGTALFAFYATQPHLLPGGEVKPDSIFPHFISHQLPPGLTGLVLAAICAAAMDSNLNSSSTLFLCDIYRRYLRPLAGERESLWVLRIATLAFGALSTAMGLAMLHVRTALDVWWQLAGIFSGGMLGLFLLGLLVARAGRRAGIAGVTCGVATILWLTFSTRWTAPLDSIRSPFHTLLTLVIGTAVVVCVGIVAASLERDRRET